MKYISLAFDFTDPSRLDDFQQMLIRLSCDLWQIEFGSDIKFEVLVNIDRKANDCISSIKEHCTTKNLCNIDFKLVSSDKLSKRYTLPTLSIDAYGGDILVYTRNIAQMSELLFTRDITQLIEMFSSDSHVRFITSEETSNTVEFYSKFYNEYHTLPEKTIGFIATRNATNSLEQTEFDYYDAVIALSMINLSIDENNLVISSLNANEKVYSTEEKEELLVKFLPHYRATLNKIQPLREYSFLPWLIVFLVAGIFYKVISFYQAILIVLVIEFIERSLIISSNHSRLLKIATQQSFAAANKKRVAGRPVITQLNKL